LTTGDEVQEFVGVVFHFYGPRMNYDQRRLETGSEFNGLQGVTLGQFAFARAVGRELIEVGRGAGDPHWQGTKVVQAGNFDFAGSDRFNNAGKKADADSVAEFGELKSEVANFLKHGAAIGVAMGVPAGGEGVHGGRAKTLKRKNR